MVSRHFLRGDKLLKYKIAEFVTEITPNYGVLKTLLEPFVYYGSQPAQIVLNTNDSQIQALHNRMKAGTSLEQTEEFAYATEFNREIIKYNAMLIHSSAIKYDKNAYLFAAESGVGKSTHTRLWQRAFGADKVKIINDDKPVVRIIDGKCFAYGTPFDGGSKIANNDFAPLKAVAFIERGSNNSIREADKNEILKNLYLSTIRFIDKQTAAAMLSNFEYLINTVKFYILTCNMDISAAQLAFDAMTKKK